jgi:putative tryptophan/tyrosine transport system substrate-binding protein
VRRREFLALVGAMAGSLPARAEQAAVPVVGYLAIGSLRPFAQTVAAFNRGLNEIGFVDGHNVRIEYRWAEGRNDRLPEFAADLVHHDAAVIAALGDVAVNAAKANTTVIPIVFMIGGDPVRDGFVTRLNHPDKDITGATWFSVDPMPKRLGILHQIVPNISVIAQLIDQNFADSASHVSEVQETARELGVELVVFGIRTADDIDKAFADLAQQGIRAVAIGPGGTHFSRREQIVRLVAQHSLPAIYPFREFALDGGLISYGNKLQESFRWAGVYVGRILKGEKPADLPIMQSITFELVVNRKTARTIGIEIPPTLLATADEVLE